MRRELRKTLCVLMAAITLSSSIQLPVRASGPAGEVQETAAEDIIIEETATEEITIEETEEDGIAPHIMDFVEIKDIHAAVTKMFLG